MENNNLSDFIKFAYEHGGIKDVQEAFIDCPVEDEFHKGKIENILEDNSAKYNFYSIGDIVFVSEYQYENGEKGHNHLFVIIDQNNMAVPIENFGMLISSQLSKLKYGTNQLIEKDNKNGLIKNSIVKTDVIYKIKNNQILFKIGVVDIEKIEEYKESYYKSVENKNKGK